MKSMKRTIAVLVAVSLMVGCVIGGTLSWLTHQTTGVVNTFTDSDVEVTLTETTGKEYKMVPGWTIPKDPKATVVTGSEDCYLFVKVEENGVSFTRNGETMPCVYSFNDFLTYEIADGWTKLDGETGVYYKVFDSKDTTNVKGTAYSILKDNKVTVQNSVTKEIMNDLETYDVNPTLTFTAYASQLYKNSTDKFSVGEAWHNISDPTDQIDYTVVE